MASPFGRVCAAYELGGKRPTTEAYGRRGARDFGHIVGAKFGEVTSAAGLGALGSALSCRA